MEFNTTMDSETEIIPIWDEPEVYYKPDILEKELEVVKKENSELKYQCSELEADNKKLRTEINALEKEKIELHKLYKQNTIELPIYRAKVLESNKVITQLNTDIKNLQLANKNSKEKREETEQKYKDFTEINTALVIANRKLAKDNAKFKLEIAQEHKDKLRTKAENEKTKAKADELEVQNKAFKAQINHHADELRSKEIFAAGLTRENQILETKTENTVKQLKDSKKCVKDLESTIKTMKKECSDSILKYSSLLHENNNLKIKSAEIDALKIQLDELKINEHALNKQNNKLNRSILKEQLEHKRLTEFILQLEKQKTKFIYTGEDMTIIKRKHEECMKENLMYINKFSNLDCPFYQSKYDKIEDKEPNIQCGSIKERQYENKIFALEQVIKTLNLKNKIQEEEHLKYRDVVIRSMYDTKNAKDKLKEANKLIDEQKYKIIYDKLEVSNKDTEIQKLEIQKNKCDNHCKLLNRQSTLLGKQLRNGYKKIESMKKDSSRANKLFKDVEQKKEDLRQKTEQSENSKAMMILQLEFNNKCQKRQQLEANKIKSTIEEFEKKINRINEELNSTKVKNEELTKAIAKLRIDTQFNNEILTKKEKATEKEMEKLLTQNKTLTFENQCLSKFKDDNILLKSVITMEQRKVSDIQKKFNKLYLEKQRNINLKRIPKL